MIKKKSKSCMKRETQGIRITEVLDQKNVGDKFERYKT